MSVRQPDDKGYRGAAFNNGDAISGRELDPFEFRSMMAEVGTTLAGILLVIVVVLFCVKVTGYQ